MFWNTFFEGAVLKFTYVLKCFFFREQLFQISDSWLLLLIVASVNSYLYAPILSLFLSVRTCMNVKTSKVLIFLLLKTLWHKYQTMNSNIYHHNNIKTQVTTNTRALIYLGLYGPVAKLISHTTFNIHCLSWKEFETRQEQILHLASQL